MADGLEFIGTVDRIEGDKAVVEGPNKTMRDIPLKNLPRDTREGDRIYFNGKGQLAGYSTVRTMENPMPIPKPIKDIVESLDSMTFEQKMKAREALTAMLTGAEALIKKLHRQLKVARSEEAHPSGIATVHGTIPEALRYTRAVVADRFAAITDALNFRDHVFDAIKAIDKDLAATMLRQTGTKAGAQVAKAGTRTMLQPTKVTHHMPKGR